MDKDGKTAIFCYGSNHPVQIAERLGLELDYVLEHCVPCTLRGYKRAYEGVAPFWESKSAATVVKDENSKIDAFAFYMTPDHVRMMDVFEGYPSFYERVPVDLMDRNGNHFTGEVYIMNPTGIFTYPSEKYLERCGMTFMAFHYLHHQPLPEDFDLYKTSFPVHNAVTGEMAGEHCWEGHHLNEVITQYMRKPIAVVE